MNIQGLQKMTLLDWPGKVACTVFLSGCDFRCPFCHNADLVLGGAEDYMSEDELLEFLSKRKNLLDGVCITGGEPLLREDLQELLQKIKALGFPVKLDTNGSHPEKLAAICRQGLVDYVAMDIKNSPARYAETCGADKMDLASVKESAMFLLHGNVDYEFRTTVVKELHDESSFKDIAEWIKGARRYFLQCFTDRESVIQTGFSSPSEQDMHNFADIVRPFVQEVSLRGV